jgi:hypothetical protein
MSALTTIYILGFPQTYGLLMTNPCYFTDLDKARKCRDEARKIGLAVHIYEYLPTETFDWNIPRTTRMKPVE